MTSRSSLLVFEGEWEQAVFGWEGPGPLESYSHRPSFTSPRAPPHGRNFFLRGAPDLQYVSPTSGAGQAGQGCQLGPSLLLWPLQKLALAGSDQKSTQPLSDSKNRRRLHASTERPQLAPSHFRILDSTATHCCRRSEHCTFDCPNLHSAACLPRKRGPKTALSAASFPPSQPNSSRPDQHLVRSSRQDVADELSILR